MNLIDSFQSQTQTEENFLLDKIPSKQIAEMALAEVSLIDYIKQAWHVVEPSSPFMSGWHLEAICDHLEALVKRQIRNLIINIPPRHMKLIADSEPVLTPYGWTTHGKLKVGDYVFSPKGVPVEIINKSPKGIADMVITFGDGSIVKCNRDHLWTVYDRTTRRWRTETTEYLSKRVLMSGKRKPRSIFQLPEIFPLSFPEVDLKLHPYFLGVWLGDGTSTKPCITHSKTDYEHIEYLESIGYIATRVDVHKDTGVYTSNFTRQNVLQDIRNLGLYNNKHIPDIYKYSSIDQRLSLLAGFIDTDGHVDKNTSRVRLCNSNKKLIDDLFELITSLGLHPYITQVESPGYDQYGYNKSHYQIGFNPLLDIPTKVSRKKIRNRKFDRRKIGIKSIEVMKFPEKGNCITVNSKDGLYLVGKKLIPTHNSLAVCVFFPTWVWLNDPSSRWLFSSYSQDLSTRDALKSRRLIQSMWYQSRWSDRFQLTSDQNQKTRYDNQHTGYRISTSVGGLATGEGGDYIGVDDPHNVQQAESEKQRKTVLVWWDETMSTRLNNPATGVKFIVMQRLHENDLTGHVLEKEAGYVHLMLPARYDSSRKCKTFIFEDPRTEDGTPLWEMYGDKELKVLEKELGTYGASGQLQQSPSPRSGGQFEVDKFQLVDNINKSEIVRSVRYWDKAGTQDGGCYSAGVLIHKMIDDSYVVADVVRGQWKAGIRNTMMKQAAMLDGYNVRVYTEQEGGSGGKESAENTIKDLAGFIVHADKVTGSKETRAEPFAAQVEIGNVKILNREWTKGYIDEHRFFPVGKYRDQVDASSGAFNKLNQHVSRAGTWGSKRR